MYYVYDLIDPRTKQTFYVGKGTGNRVSQHVKDAKKGVVGLKCDIIRDILDEGLSVKEKIVKRFECEDAAYAYEKKRISKIGVERLTNIAHGGREITSEAYYERKDARLVVKSLCRLIRLRSKHHTFVFKWCGVEIDVSMDRLNKMISAGIVQVYEILGKSMTIEEFRKNNVLIENNI